MQLTPLIAFHMGCALGATAIGPVALWARRRGAERPALHRMAGYAFVLLMLGTALSALLIRDFLRPNWMGFTPIHLLIPVSLGALALSFWHLAHHRIDWHRRIMRRLYFGACLIAGFFTLVPGRLLGDLLWQQIG
jgi:uncharacterized membrane protein